jgi:hypothetical protein
MSTQRRFLACTSALLFCWLLAAQVLQPSVALAYPVALDDTASLGSEGTPYATYAALSTSAGIAVVNNTGAAAYFVSCTQGTPLSVVVGIWANPSACSANAVVAGPGVTLPTTNCQSVALRGGASRALDCWWVSVVGATAVHEVQFDAGASPASLNRTGYHAVPRICAVGHYPGDGSLCFYGVGGNGFVAPGASRACSPVQFSAGQVCWWEFLGP